MLFGFISTFNFVLLLTFLTSFVRQNRSKCTMARESSKSRVSNQWIDFQKAISKNIVYEQNVKRKQKILEHRTSTTSFSCSKNKQRETKKPVANNRDSRIKKQTSLSGIDGCYVLVERFFFFVATMSSLANGRDGGQQN